MMHGHEKSDSAIVARKLANKAVSTAAEPVERRAGTKGNANQQSMGRAQNRATLSQALERIRQVAKISASPSLTQGGSRVREFRLHGSERGAASNGRPYRTFLSLTDAVEKVAKEMLWNRNAQRSNPAARFFESTLRVRS